MSDTVFSGTPSPAPGRAQHNNRSAWTAVLLAVPIVFSAVAYAPLLRTYFFSDDFLNLFEIVDGDPLEYLLTPHGGHLLLTRNAVFYLFFQVFGAHAEFYFAIVWATHLLNVALLFAILRRWTGGDLLAAFGATVWGASPIHSETLGWYSVYGQVIVATALLVILFQASGCTRRGSAPAPSALVLWPLLLLVASSSFGVGIGLTVVAPVALFLLLPASPTRTRICLLLAALALASPLLYRGFLALNENRFGASPEVWNAQMLYHHIDYGNAAALLLHLLGNGILRPLFGFVAAPRFFATPTIYAAIAVFLALVAAALVRAPVSARRGVGLLLLALASYGAIAVGRGTFFALEQMPRAATTPRYHYVGSLFLVLLLCTALRSFAAARGAVRTGALLFAAWLLVDLMSFASARPFLILHIAARREVDQVRAAVESAVEAAPPGAKIYIDNQPFRSVGPLLVNDRKRFPGWAAAFAFLYPANVVEGRRVYFIDDDPDVLKHARDGKRTAGLIVSSAEAAKAAKAGPVPKTTIQQGQWRRAPASATPAPVEATR